MKRFMIAVLAVAVLFGFAACDNENGGSASFQDMVVTSIAVIEGPEQYFDGEELDVEDYKVEATRVNGDTFVVPASDLTFGNSPVTAKAAAEDPNDDVTAKVVGTLTYKGAYAMTTVTVDVKASVYKLNALNVEQVGAAKQYYTSQKVADINRTDYKVTAYAIDSDDNVVYSRELGAKEYTINGDASANFESGNVTLTFAPVSALGTVANPEGYKNTASISVAIDSVSSISIALKKDAEAIIGVAPGDDATSYVDITYNMTSGVKLDEAPEGAETVKCTWTGLDAEKKFSDAVCTITATYGTGTNAPTATAEIKPVANYIKSFTVSATYATASDATEPADSVKETLTITTGTKAIKTADMTVTVAWASGSAPATGAPDASDLAGALRITDGVKDNLTEFSTAGYAAGKELPISFYLTGLTSFVTDKTECEITTVVMQGGSDD